jgi:hypothetical protein
VLSLLDGTVSRADAHRWASRWVEGDDPDISDPMVWSALQRLHGFDLVWTDSARTTVRHGGPGARWSAVIGCGSCRQVNE